MTKKMPALFAKHPPKKPIVDLKTLVDDWIYRFGSKGVSKQMRDEVVDHCAASRNYREAVGRAVDSVRPNGKMHNHQSRIPRSVKESSTRPLMPVKPHTRPRTLTNCTMSSRA
jgi:hypothetical protein